MGEILAKYPTNNSPHSPHLFSLEFETAIPGKNLQINRSHGKAEFFAEDLGNGVILEMVTISGEKFIMGFPENEPKTNNYERPQHNVTIQPFFMGKYPVTQERLFTISENKTESDSLVG